MSIHTCVIGGTGFIGSHFVHALSVLGRRITVIGRNAVPTRVLPKKTTYLAGDYSDTYFLRGVLRNVQEVICLAHNSVPKTSFDDPVSDILGNLPGAVKLFETAADLGIRKLIFVSSGGTVYGPASRLPLSEESPTRPISPYGISKLAMENYAFMYHAIRGLPVVCARPANAYGEGQLPFTGQGFIATAMAAVLRGEEIVLYGENGTIRDYVHVTDVASGIVALLNNGTAGECYNIGSGIGINNREVLQAIAPLAGAAGLEVKIRVVPPRGFDVPANILDCTKIKNETGWGEIVTIDNGIRRTWDWLRERITMGCSES